MMAQDLDPRLKKIIEDAASNTLFPDSIYPSHFSENSAHLAHARYLDNQRPRDEFRFLPVGIHQGASMLPGNDRYTPQSKNLSEQLNHNDAHDRLSIPIRNPHSSTTTNSIPNPPFIRHNPQRQLINQPIYQSHSGLGALEGKPQTSRIKAPEPTAIFPGIDNSRPYRPQQEEPRTPLNISSYVYTPPAATAGTPSSFDSMSSPSNRISLRRRAERPRTMAFAEAPEAFVNDKMPIQARVLQDSIKYPICSRTPTSSAGGTPPIVHGIQLISPHELPDNFRQVFPYKLFNAVQSKCFAPVYKTDDNVVISAPTGSGKTAILELAICRLALRHSFGQFKIVYQAPTKSLCGERVRDWEKKFWHLNLPCAELTGDTDASEMRKVGAAAILVTTPEKWDSITRKWQDYIKLLQMVKLFLIDEVHILKDVRGATLEAVVSRMKSIGANVRFIALSATVPNSQDIATWLGKDHTKSHLPAHREVFGEEFRPVKLQKHVYGYSGSPNDFAFESVLDTKLPDLIAKHTKRKPMMIFCFTRKSCENTALKLAEWWSSLRVTDRAWPAPTYKVVVGSPELRDLVGRGVAFHHAGLDPPDRTAIESAFLKGCISVICCTSTLAVGINLPCHLVVIKNTACYTDGGLGEYSDLEMMQMLGRAGRPQFDDSATAIIMTRLGKVDSYNKMISGQDILESTLHRNLIEHLNSEIALGTISDIYSAKFWLAGTFLSVRMRLNPSHYKFSCDTGSKDADLRLEKVCERDIELLQKAKLITDKQRFTTTAYGQAMSKYLVQFETMKLLLSIPQHAKITQILQIISQAAEFRDIRMRPNERTLFRELNKSPFIKSPIKENIGTYAHKVSLIVQVQLGGVDLPSDKEFNSNRRQFISETSIVFERIKRLIRCFIECKAYDCDAIATCNALELARSIAAGFWENSTLQLRQIPNIGPAAMRKLVQSNVKTVHEMFLMNTAAIERALSRNPPCGRKILDLLASFPRLTLRAEIVKNLIKERVSIKVYVRALLGYANAMIPTWIKRAPALTFVAAVSNGTLAHIWRGPVRKLEKGFEITFTCELLSPDDSITCSIACEEIVGTVQSVTLSPDISAGVFPLAKTPPECELMPHNECAESADGENTTPNSSKVAKTGGDTSHSSGDVDSDYGGDSVFDDFVDIDALDVKDTSHDETDIERQLTNTEPIRMANGKWQCNHPCSDGQSTKKGQPCKHRCCKEGLDKPRKLQKKKLKGVDDSQTVSTTKATVQTPSINARKVSNDRFKPRLKLAERNFNFDDIEELDLVDKPFVAKRFLDSANVTPEAASSSFESGHTGSIRMSRISPRYFYPNGSAPDLSHFGASKQDTERSDENLPSPSEILSVRDLLTYEQTKPDSTLQTTPKNIKGTENQNGNVAVGFKAFEATTSRLPSSAHKRGNSSSPVEQLSKRLRLTTEEQRYVESSVPVAEPSNPEPQPVPEWAKEFEPDLVAYFFGPDLW